MRKAYGSIKPHEIHSSQGIKNSNSTTNKTTQKVEKKTLVAFFLFCFIFFCFLQKKRKTRMIINACWVCHRTMSAAVPSAATATAPSPVLDSGWWVLGSHSDSSKPKRQATVQTVPRVAVLLFSVQQPPVGCKMQPGKNNSQPASQATCHRPAGWS